MNIISLYRFSAYQNHMFILFLVYTLPEIPAYFNGRSSFIAYPQLLDNSHHFDITIKFRTEHKDGLIFYAQGPRGIQDYAIIGMKNRRIHLR